MTFAAWLLAARVLTPQAADPPADVVRVAQQAVEGDSVAAVSARWTARLRRNPADRAAELGLATLARFTYRYDEAERRYARLLPPTGQPADRYSAYARLGYGIGLRWRGRVVEAEPWLAQAAADAQPVGDPSLEAEALLALTAARIRTRGLAAGESLVTQASRISPANDLRLQALLRCTRAGVLASGARPEAAREAEAGAELARRAGEARLVANCRHAVAQDLLRRGDVAGASRVWVEVEAEQRRMRDRVGLAATLQWHGYAASTVAQYGAALAYFRASVIEGEASGNLSPVGFALTGLGRIALQVGDVAAGMHYASRAKALFDGQGDRIGVLSMLGLEGELARTAGRLSDAATIYRDALALAEHDGRWDWVVPIRTALVDLALAAGDGLAADRLIDSAVAVARARGMSGWEEGMAHQRGLVALLRNDLDGAERAFTADVAGARTPFRNYRARARLAEVYARRGDVARAERELVAATDTLELWRASLSDRDLRLQVFQLQEHWVDPDLGIATILGSLVEAGRVAQAFHLAERRRARELLDRLMLANALRSAGGDSAAPPAAARAARMDELAAALPNDHIAVLEYVTGRGGEPTIAFVVTKGGGTAHLLPPIDSLSEAIARFTALVEAGNPPRALATTLGGALLGPVLAGLPPAVDHLVIVPDEILHRLPFDVLVMNDGRQVVERFATSVAPSATVGCGSGDDPKPAGRQRSWRWPIRSLRPTDPGAPTSFPASRPRARRRRPPRAMPPARTCVSGIAPAKRS